MMYRRNDTPRPPNQSFVVPQTQQLQCLHEEARPRMSNAAVYDILEQWTKRVIVAFNTNGKYPRTVPLTNLQKVTVIEGYLRAVYAVPDDKIGKPNFEAYKGVILVEYNSVAFATNNIVTPLTQVQTQVREYLLKIDAFWKLLLQRFAI